MEEKSSGSTTTHSDFSLPEYDSFIFDLSIDPLPRADRSVSHHEEFTDELAHIISSPEYDRFYFDLEIVPGEFTREEYDIWAMEKEHYLEYIDNDVWKVIKNRNSKKRISTGKDGVIRILPPVTATEIQAIEKERKAKNILLMAIPKEHMRRFHGMDDAKEIWEAIRTSTCTPSTSSTNAPEKEVLAGFADELFIFLFANKQKTWTLLHEDLKQIDDLDIEEMDINWQIAMIAIRMKKFYKKTGRRVRAADGKKALVGFLKKRSLNGSIVTTLTGHFARECTTKGTHDGKKRRDSFYQHQEARKQEKNQMGLLTMDDGIVNWGEHTEDEETNHALMAISSSSEVSLCSKTCINSYNELKTLCDEQMNQLGDQEVQILAYSQAVKKLEAQLVTFQKQQLSLNEKLTFQANEIYEKDEKLKKYRRIGMKAVKEKEQLQKTLDSWKDSSKNLWRLINSGMSSNSKVGLGYEIQSNNEVLSYEEEMNFSIFNCSKEDSVGKPLYSRFIKTNDFKGVPHPLSGDYTPTPQEEIDESLYVYGKKGPQEPEPNVSDDRSSEYSTCQSKMTSGRILLELPEHFWINHANQYVSRPVQLKTGWPNINSVRTNINTGRTNINSVMPRVNTVNTNVNTIRSRQLVPTRTSNSLSPKSPQGSSTEETCFRQLLLWPTALLDDGTLELHATIDTIVYTITEASIRNKLQLKQIASGITMCQTMRCFRVDSLEKDLKQTKLTIGGDSSCEVVQEGDEAEAAKLFQVASQKPKSIDKGRRYKRRKETKGKKVVTSLDFQEEVSTGMLKELILAILKLVLLVAKLVLLVDKLVLTVLKRSFLPLIKGQEKEKPPLIHLKKLPNKTKGTNSHGGSSSYMLKLSDWILWRKKKRLNKYTWILS
ncbi:hypothetical protein Tco_0145937 [Tanacetum coccineum]